MNPLQSTSPFWYQKGVAMVRIIAGALIVYHGSEIFQQTVIDKYLSWDMFKGSSGAVLVYTGKASELMAGVSILLGLFTRLGAVLAMVTFSYITFFVGNGRFWYEDQHPFLFALIGLMLFFTGPGAWSVDGLTNKEEIN